MCSGSSRQDAKQATDSEGNKEVGADGGMEGVGEGGGGEGQGLHKSPYEEHMRVAIYRRLKHWLKKYQGEREVLRLRVCVCACVRVCVCVCVCV